jgi:RNA polymerase sigma-70 factor (ECF subfamily)
MVAFQQGDADAFDALVGRYQRALINYFYKRCYDRVLAEDLMQETFLRLIRHRAKYRPEASFRTYLYRVATNLFIDLYRSKKAAPKAVSADVRVNEDGATIGDLLEAREVDAINRIEDTEAAEMVRTALEELPEAQRSVFLLVVDQGLKYREVAEVLDVPVGTVKSRVNAAVTRLRGMLGHVLG